MNFKKLISVFCVLSVFLSVLSVSQLNVFATEDDEEARVTHPMISILDVSDPKKVKSYFISDMTEEEEEKPNPPEGVSFDYATNTMTLDHYQNDYALVQVGGGPLTVHVIGECSFMSLIMLTSKSLHFTGDGVLTVNRIRRSGIRGLDSGAVDLLDNDPGNCPKITFSKDFTGHFYGDNNGSPAVRVSPYRDYDPSAVVYSFENSKEYPVEKIQSPYEVNQEISGYIIRDTDTEYILGEICKKASDPNGIYTVKYNEYEMTEPGYCVQKYLYSDKYQTYLPDPDFYEQAGAYEPDSDAHITRFEGLFYFEDVFNTLDYTATNQFLSTYGYLDQRDYLDLYQDRQGNQYVIIDHYDEFYDELLSSDVYSCVKDPQTGVTIFELNNTVSPDSLEPVTDTYYNIYYTLPNEFHYYPEDVEDPTTEQPVTEAEEIIVADVDGDGLVSVIDATRIQKFMAQICLFNGAEYNGSKLTAAQIKTADVDMDGVVSVLDATRIQKYKAKICNLDGTKPYSE